MKTEPCSEIYVHIPFCARKCGYCDFYSVAAGRGAQKEYFRELREEIREFEIPDFPGSRRVASVFFGGGTPSLPEAKELCSVLGAVRERFRLTEDAEITLEANPGVLTPEKLSEYRRAGFNRLSLGLQVSDDSLLRKLGRVHTAGQFRRTFLAAREAGFDNISADLLSGIPGQCPEAFLEGLARLIRLRPEHISVYSLIIEEGTPFYELYGPEGAKREELPGELEDRYLVHRTGELLSGAGYRQYEISNYALPGRESRHNTGYWTGIPYYGFGAAAASCLPVSGGGEIAAVRKKNAESLYYRRLPPEETEELTEEDLKAEFMILGLRMNRGVSEEEFRERFGTAYPEKWGEIIARYEGFGALKTEGGRTFLTSYGRDVANRVMADFL